MNTITRSEKIKGELWEAIYSRDRLESFVPEYDARYRFLLSRVWNSLLPMIAYIGLNPSTATHLTNDPTVTRCIGDSKSLGYGGMFMLNIWPIRTPNPQLLKAYKRFNKDWDDANSENVTQVVRAAQMSKTVVAAWSGHARWNGQGQRMYDILRGENINLHCYKLGENGEPWHRLYIENNTPLIPYSR